MSIPMLVREKEENCSNRSEESCWREPGRPPTMDQDMGGAIKGGRRTQLIIKVTRVKKEWTDTWWHTTHPEHDQYTSISDPTPVPTPRPPAVFKTTF